jgi:NADH-quinone oxidoreductase subunit K
MVPLAHYLTLSVILFVLGAAGFILRRNIISVFMCIELMLNAVNLAFMAFSRFLGSLDGQLFVFFVIVVAAAEAAVGLAIIIALYRNRESLNIEDLDSMKM